MRVLVWPANDDASAWYRMKFPAFALAAQGVDVVIDQIGPRAYWDRSWDGKIPPLEARCLGLETRPDADVVVINRPVRAHWAEIIPHLQKAGVKVVVDLDDDFEAIQTDNSAFATYSTKHTKHCKGVGLRPDGLGDRGRDCQIAHQWANKDWIMRAATLADLVTVSTPALKDRYGHGKCAVLPNLVPESYLAIRPPDPLPNTFGWSGRADTHPGDLQSVGDGVVRALADHQDWGVHVVGIGRGVPAALRVPAVSALTSWVPFSVYPRELARIAVGMVPLAATRFNRGKSALKMAEFAAVGVPVVASATPDNRRLHGHGIGLLADSPAQWWQHLSAMAESADRRAEFAGRGREAMAQQTYEQGAELWAEAWASTIKGRVRA